MDYALRLAAESDIPELGRLIAQSVRVLQAPDYSAAQREGALGTVFGVDRQLIADRTYFVAAAPDGALAGCGGWSRRQTLFGSDHSPVKDDAFLDPARDAARIRAFFVHPDHARRGLGRRILEACEAAAREHGFSRFELGATLTGIPLYEACGYAAVERIEVPLTNGAVLPVVRMRKSQQR
jgi:GNAT superfamily N-acetyltransferase